LCLAGRRQVRKQDDSKSDVSVTGCSGALGREPLLKVDLGNRTLTQLFQ